MKKVKIIQIFSILITLISCQNKFEKSIKEDKNIFFDDDFSTELFLTVNPFETDKVTFDYTLKRKPIGALIYIGKIKKNYLKRYKNLNKNQYYIQLNEKIEGVDNLQRFILGCNSNINNQLIFIHADKDTPKEFLTRVESEFFECNINKEQIYYLTINKSELKSGYNQNY